MLELCALRLSDTIGPRFTIELVQRADSTARRAAQELHVDVRPDEDAWPLLGFIVMVDEFREDNGATRFVPGSHRAEPTRAREGNQRPDDGATCSRAANAGSVIVYLGSTWHGYSANRSASRAARFRARTSRAAARRPFNGGTV